MHILTSAYTFDYSGTPTYTVTMIRELERLGHTVEVYSPMGGKLGSEVNLITNLSDTQFSTPDLILAQHTTPTRHIKARFPSVPTIYIAHGPTAAEEQAPLDVPIDRWVAINQQVKDALIHQGVTQDITIVRDFIDMDTFACREPLQVSRPRVLFISNYKKWHSYAWLEKACRWLSYPFRAIGAPYGRSRNIVADINASDLIVSWGRGILEGMSCGRPVVSFDKEYGDGYLDTETYLFSREHNFSHWLPDDCRYHFDVPHLVDHLFRYRAPDGAANRKLIEMYHDVRVGVPAILGTLA